MENQIPKQTSLSLQDGVFDFGLTLEDLSGDYKKNDLWSGVVSRDVPVDTVHAVFRIGDEITLNEALRNSFIMAVTNNGRVVH